LPLPDSLDKQRPHLRVRQLVKPDSSGSKYMFLPVPVLKGTEVEAAAVDNRQLVSAAKLKDGSSVLLLPATKQPAELEYWLKPAKSQKIHAVAPIVSTRTGRPLTTAEISWEWDSYIPDVYYMPAGRRLRAEKRYILDKFDYSLRPLPNSDALKSELSYARHVLGYKMANCNTANTLLAISNPRQLNYVGGFYNSNTPEQVEGNKMHLSSSEAHAWTVDKKGRRRDATPVKGVSSADAAYFKENYAEAFSNPAETRSEQVQRLIYGAGLLTLSGLLVLNRRRLGGAAVSARHGYAGLRISTVRPRQRQLAYAVINQAIYDDRPIDKSRFTQSLQRANSNPEKTDAAWRNFARSHNPKSVKQTLKNSSKVPDAAARRALRRGQRLHKLYRARSG
jgi:hypothetical protein